MTFSEKLQKLRKAKGMSQEALADMLDVSRQAISKWESGQSYPEMDNLIALSNLFGVTLDSFIKESDLQSDEANTVAEPFWANRGRVYEYKSNRKIMGMPLVHIHIGFGVKRAKGFIAIGNIAQGFISLGLVSAGVISGGLLSAGIISFGILAAALLLAIGSLSIGIFSIGAVALGIFTLGAVSVGMFSTGAVAVASHIAIGDHAYGHVAVGQTLAEGVRTFVSAAPRDNFASINGEQVRKAILEEFPNMWRWIVRIMTVFL